MEKKGGVRIIPTVVPAIIITNPRPYPKIIPASHIDGPEGIRNTGNSAKEATSTRARTGRPNAVASQCRVGIRIYKI
ncbi:hypothetical protein H5410_011058 [Solanum commersonii]|uniref:Uncharacterized protein n=1 Tax=Solanum commersonii TaxID=4109 RepID=A0A9J6AMG4_SOLCO|nr:hypothetical protein H5410_011058 [Solanum commersonii]